MSFLLAPFQFGFMQVALLAALLVAVTCASLGVYVVLRRMAFVGDALAHTVLPGLVVAYLQGWNLFAGALVAGLATAFGIGWLSQRQVLREDSAIGVLFTAMFALGIVLMSATGSYRDFTHMLFGNLLGISPRSVVLIAAVAAVVLIALALLGKELELASFDPTYAEVIGISTDRLRYLLLALLALTVVSGIQAVGVLLTSALLVTPGAAASLLTTRLPRMLLLANLFAVGSAVAGLYGSYHLGVSPGAAIVLASTLCFALAWSVRGARQALVRRRQS